MELLLSKTCWTLTFLPLLFIHECYISLWRYFSVFDIFFPYMLPSLCFCRVPFSCLFSSLNFILEVLIKYLVMFRMSIFNLKGGPKIRLSALGQGLIMLTSGLWEVARGDDLPVSLRDPKMSVTLGVVSLLDRLVFSKMKQCFCHLGRRWVLTRELGLRAEQRKNGEGLCQHAACIKKGSHSHLPCAWCLPGRSLQTHAQGLSFCRM